MPGDWKRWTMDRFGMISGSNSPQLTKSRSATRTGRSRYRLTNCTTGSNTGSPPWSVPGSANTNDPDMRTSDPYERGDEYAVDSAATAPKLAPKRTRPDRCDTSGNSV